MHILFVGYGKTSQRVAKSLFQQQHQITTISRSPKTDDFATHLIQDVHQMDLSQVAQIDVVYVLLAHQYSMTQNSIDLYRHTYIDSVQPIVQALKSHPIQRVIVLSSTRVYGEDQGEWIDDKSIAIPCDEQGRSLLEMEKRWQQAYPYECVIVRPTGIYGTSTTRMIKLAETTKTYPNIHWSNRIHIDDLARFLVHLIHVERLEKSYICSDNMPTPLHERILNIQREWGLPELILESQVESGKRIFAERMLGSEFELKTDDS
ncbi:NAD(P)-dependent oxidoreductase [Acinetobacter sp. TGL-Y2]|uniref:NAD-dependent epimerase/dehydratase family protein n=1 Tax=Acinetobacter sp. TGL-Y2 TaxID=1407071 RepID=UPI0007A67734|nr:NAD-dependent epimerase/dehydratase family protein [Acinetobacter sp. TGL-Y2]AMW79924.1 NAD(P)-dependent oxidoreductase [Acinetobacter sp. TGL-Y2]